MFCQNFNVVRLVLHNARSLSKNLIGFHAAEKVFTEQYQYPIIV